MLVLFFHVVMVTVLVLMGVLIILVMVMMFLIVGVFMLVMMILMLVNMMVVFVRMRVSVRLPIRMSVLVAVLVREVNVEFDSFDGGFVSAGNVQVVIVKLQLFQFVLQVARIDAEIEQRADKHVAADPAEDIQI